MMQLDLHSQRINPRVHRPSRSSVGGKCLPQVLILLGLCVAAPGCAEFWIKEADREVYRLIEKRQQQALGATTDVRIDGPAAIGTDPSARVSPGDPYAFVPNPIDNDVPESFKRASTATRPADIPTAQDSADGEQAVAEPARPDDLANDQTVPPADAQADRMPAPPDGAQAGKMPAPLEDAPSATAAQGNDLPPEAPLVPDEAMATANRPEMDLAEVLAYAFRHARDFQTAKEQLYLAALDLTLERYLWGPRAFGDVSVLHSILQSPVADERGNVTLEPDNALEAVARAGVRQRLPYGGEVVAQVINTLVRDVTHHVTEGETGQTLIQAELPLLRGAGRVAYESRYQAERNLIYAIRTFEGFRRNLVVEIADDYFNLQRLRQEIINTEQSVQSFSYLAEQTRALWKVGGRRTVLDVQRADQERLIASNDRVDAITTYETALDAFKLRIGMPVETPIDVPLPDEPGAAGAPPDKDEATLEDALRMPDVTEEEAIAAALKYRLDLLNDLDRIGDAERGINIAENNLLPDLKATSSVRLNTRTEQLGAWHYDDEYNTYDVGIALELPLDRKAEQDALRRSHITKNQAQRDYELARHTVILQVRSAMRRVQQQQLSLEIQIKNRDLALQRREAARIQLERGLIGNRDVVEAENALLSARNRLAAAQAQLSLAILQFRRNTGTLRVDDQGRWDDPVQIWSQPVASGTASKAKNDG